MLLKDDANSQFEYNSMRTIAWMMFHDDDYMQKTWILTRLFAHMHWEEQHLISGENGVCQAEASSRMGELFGSMVASLGGWLGVRDILFYSARGNVHDTTWSHVSEGFIIGEVLLAALINGGNITNACEAALENSQQKYVISVLNNVSVEIGSRNIQSPDSIKKNLWYKNVCVAHCWAAAKLHFSDPNDFVERLMYHELPFEVDNSGGNSGSGYFDFLQLASDIYDAATQFRAETDGREKPLIGKEFDRFPPWIEISPVE